MNAEQFFRTTEQMRAAQKNYFATRDKVHLENSKRLEKIIDDEILRVNKILDMRKLQQDLQLEQQ